MYLLVGMQKKSITFIQQEKTNKYKNPNIRQQQF